MKEITIIMTKKGLSFEMVEGKNKLTSNDQKKIRDFLAIITKPDKIKLYITKNAKGTLEKTDYIRLIFQNTVIRIEDKTKSKILYKNILSKYENVPFIRKVRTAKIYNKRLLAAILAGTITLSGLAVYSIIHLNRGDKQSSETYSTSEELIDSTPSLPIVEDPEIVSIPEFLQEIKQDFFDVETRLEEVKTNIQVNSIISSNLNEYTLNKIYSFINSEVGKYTIETAIQFGIDPYVFIGVMLNESSLEHESTIPTGKNYNGCAVGICQLENPQGQKVQAYNYFLDKSEVMEISMENAIDEKTNIKIGIMMFRTLLEHYNGNILLAIQAYNYGQTGIDLIIDIYADELTISKEEVCKNIKDTGWLKYVQELHDDPKAFAEKYHDYQKKYPNAFSQFSNWPGTTYGTSNYIEKTLSYYFGAESKNIIDGELVKLDLRNDIKNIAISEDDKKVIL